MTITITGSVGKDGINRHHDVEIVQTLINRQAKSIAPLRPLRVDGVVGARTIAAIEAYQRNVLSEAEPDGLVDTNGKTIRSLRSAAPGASAIPFGSRQVVEPTSKWVNVAAVEASWMGFADGEQGVTERKGFDVNNTRIIEYMNTFPYLKNTLNKKTGQYYGKVDETAWCACFVNWCLKKAGKAGGPSAKAEHWQNYGKGLDTPVPGAITVLYKQPKPGKPGEDSPTGFHVAFFVSNENGFTLLGGNQDNTVKVKAYPQHSLIAYRWPL